MTKETQKTKIKRVAQFLFDNAGDIRRQLRKSDNHRSISISLNFFKHDGEDLQIELSNYDSDTTHYFLRDNAICIERFEQVWKQINEETGVIPLPKPVEVRKKL